MHLTFVFFSGFVVNESVAYVWYARMCSHLRSARARSQLCVCMCLCITRRREFMQCMRRARECDTNAERTHTHIHTAYDHICGLRACCDASALNARFQMLLTPSSRVMLMMISRERETCADHLLNAELLTDYNSVPFYL